MSLESDIRHAAEHGDIVRLEALLDASSDLANTRHEGVTPLHFAALRGHLAAIGLLISRGAKIDAVDDEYGSQPIGWANETGQSAAVDLLDELGASYSASQAAGFGKFERLREKLDRDSSLLNTIDGWGAPLHSAVLWGRSEIVRDLLDRGADPWLRNANGHNAFELAIQQAANPRWGAPIVSPDREAELRKECAAIAEMLER